MPPESGVDSLFDPYALLGERAIWVASWKDAQYEETGDSAQVYGVRNPVTGSEARSMPYGTLVFHTETAEDRLWVDALLASGRVVGFRPGYARYGLDYPTYLSVGRVLCSRVVSRPSAVERKWTLSVQQVAAPAVA